jgi:NitT/TauT family transport system substrate-binding protein
MKRMDKAIKRISLLVAALLMTGVLGACSDVEKPAESTTTTASQVPTEGTAESSASSENANEDFVLRIGYGGSLCEAPLHAAVEKGFFEEEGLKVELIKLATGTAFDAVTSNQTDAGFGLLASLIQPLTNGLPIKITTGLHTGCDKLLIKEDSGINSVHDLKGKTIGIASFTASPYIYTQRVLADNGIGVVPGNLEVNFVVYATADLPNALAQGQVDAIALNDPTATIAANDYGYKVLLDSATDIPYKDQYCCSAYVRENIASDYPDIALKYTRAMQKASAWVAENQDEIAQIQSDKAYVAGDPKVNAEVLKTFQFLPSYEGAVEIFRSTSKQLQEFGIIDADIDTDALTDNSFIYLEGIPFVENSLKKSN